jgi:hypothetical protein
MRNKHDVRAGLGLELIVPLFVPGLHSFMGAWVESNHRIATSHSHQGRCSSAAALPDLGCHALLIQNDVEWEPTPNTWE